MDESVAVTVTAHEARALEYIRQAMQHRYPGLPASVIAERMRKVHHRYDNARIRDFVPLLVERELKAEFGAGASLPRHPSDRP